jgi:DNA mismatch endonuclease (patch repair protein)
MSRIRGRGNKGTELALAGIMRRHQIKGWRRHQPIFGRPDFVFLSLQLAIFVDGCFWHMCPKHSTMPTGNRTFWELKLVSNRRRDLLVARTLRAQGWCVLRLWEHELSPKNEARCVQRIRRAISNSIVKRKRKRLPLAFRLLLHK